MPTVLPWYQRCYLQYRGYVLLVWGILRLMTAIGVFVAQFEYKYIKDFILIIFFVFVLITVILNCTTIIIFFFYGAEKNYKRASGFRDGGTIAFIFSIIFHGVMMYFHITIAMYIASINFLDRKTAAKLLAPAITLLFMDLLHQFVLVIITGKEIARLDAEHQQYRAVYNSDNRRLENGRRSQNQTNP